MTNAIALGGYAVFPRHGGADRLAEALQIGLTSALTVLGDLLILVLGECLTRFCIEPFHEQSELRGEIAYFLVWYADFQSNPGITNRVLADEAPAALRRQAAICEREREPLFATGSGRHCTSYPGTLGLSRHRRISSGRPTRATTVTRTPTPGGENIEEKLQIRTEP